MNVIRRFRTLYGILRAYKVGRSVAALRVLKCLFLGIPAKLPQTPPVHDCVVCKGRFDHDSCGTFGEDNPATRYTVCKECHEQASRGRIAHRRQGRSQPPRRAASTSASASASQPAREAPPAQNREQELDDEDIPFPF